MHLPKSFRPIVTRLEDRTNPAGNVIAQVIDGTLVIDGDAASNSIIVAGCGWQSVAVRPGDSGTTINGLPGGQGLFLGDITRGIVIRTNEGEDTVVLEGLRNRHYIGVFTGSGEDLVILNGVEGRGTTEISTGADDDKVLVRNSTFRKSAAVDLGAGNDTLEVIGSNARKRVQFNGGDGTNDTLAADGSQFRTSIGYRNFETVMNGPLPPPLSLPGAPSVVITSSAGESSALAAIPFTVTFSEGVTGFDLNDLGVTNGTPANLDTDDNITYTFTVTPAQDGAITVVLPAGVAVDADGEGNAAASLTVRSIRSTADLIGVNTDDAGKLTTVINPPAVNDPNWVATGSGLSIWDIREGSGTAVAGGDKILAFYTGWLTNSTVFDSQRNPDDLRGFTVIGGVGGVIEGFREGLIGMKPGGIRRLLIPAALAYKDVPQNNIPANSTLIFEVKLVSVTPQDATAS